MNINTKLRINAFLPVGLVALTALVLWAASASTPGSLRCKRYPPGSHLP